MNTALVVEVNNVLSLADTLLDTIKSCDDPSQWDAAIEKLQTVTTHVIDLYRHSGAAAQDYVVMGKLNYHTNKVLKALGK